MKVYERVLNALSWIGIIVLVPIGLAVFGIPGPLDFLHRSLGKFGSASFFVIVFYGLILLRILLGKSEIYAPVLIGAVVSFFLLTTTVEIGFMQWYRRLTDSIVYLGNHRFVFLVAVGVVVLGILLGGLKKLHWVIQLIFLVILPFALVVLAQIYGFAPLGAPAA